MSSTAVGRLTLVEGGAQGKQFFLVAQGWCGDGLHSVLEETKGLQSEGAQCTAGRPEEARSGRNLRRPCCASVPASRLSAIHFVLRSSSDLLRSTSRGRRSLAQARRCFLLLRPARRACQGWMTSIIMSGAHSGGGRSCSIAAAGGNARPPSRQGVSHQQRSTCCLLQAARLA